jgi:PiT family inorganic phosphate transporter
MIFGLDFIVIAVIILALTFDFINGFHDTANSIATSVATRVLTPVLAIAMAAVLNFAGAMVSHNVAKTISSGLVSSAVVPQYVIIAAVTAAIVWDLITWYFGIPSSSSHALIGGLIGAAMAYTMSLKIILWKGVLYKVVIPLLTSPLAGFIIGFLLMELLFFLLRNATPLFVNRWFAKLQIVSAAFMSFTHGMNDAQKSMGIITFALISAGLLPQHSNVPVAVMVACGLAMALGTAFGGWKIIKTMGVHMMRLQPINGFAAETSAALTIAVASHFGMPISTTHVISSSIIGIGASKRLKSVRWSLALSIVKAWFVTIPATMLIGALVVFGFKLFIHG